MVKRTWEGAEFHDDSEPDGIRGELPLVEFQVAGLLAVIKQLEGTNRSKWDPHTAESVLRQVYVVFPFKAGTERDSEPQGDGGKWLRVHRSVTEPLKCSCNAMSKRVKRVCRLYGGIPGIQHVDDGGCRMVPDDWKGCIILLRDIMRKQQNLAAPNAFQGEPTVSPPEYRGSDYRRERKRLEETAPRLRKRVLDRADAEEFKASISSLIESHRREILSAFESTLDELLEKFTEELQNSVEIVHPFP
ncbi:hypothetical protein NDN08_008173 [Rhodosorus marinus]|uniref:Uncharacterized protein n=1 Tax=Rhodosorus marinus TaxID=101924 RepID=A0AAV8V3J1_9RHOD|nr:hypothetical protein NDN08_008173 [Rhodosorus marinus]